MKVLIQIPCYNEEKTLPITLWNLPRTLPNVDTVEWLVVDDGSTDKTVQIAKDFGVDHILCLKKHMGLGVAFYKGINKALSLGADIIVNTDADNQYPAVYISKLIEPIISKKAEMVIGKRPILEIGHFSIVKKFWQIVGSFFVRLFSNTNVPDARCGFRAFSGYFASRLKVLSSYTYTMETIIQAGHAGIPIATIPITVNSEIRRSRLIKSIPNDLLKSGISILLSTFRYSPITFFGFALMSIASILFILSSYKFFVMVCPVGFIIIYFSFFIKKLLFKLVFNLKSTLNFFSKTI